MTATPERPALDEATLAFAEKVFDAARQGDVARLALWLDNGLPPDLRNAQGDSLLMLGDLNQGLAMVRSDALRQFAEAILSGMNEGGSDK